MIKRLASKMRRIWRGIKEMATYWTSIGVMLIPIGIAILIQWPKAEFIAFGLIVVGGILGIVGLGYTIRDERDKHKESIKAEERRQADEKRRRREHREDLGFLASLASKHGISTPRLIRLIERLEEREKEDEL